MDSRDPAHELPASGPLISVVLPVGGADMALEGVLRSYAQALEKLGASWELLLVPAFGQSLELSSELLSVPGMRICATSSGWGAAVRTGLAASAGQVLCYTNWHRTSPEALTEMIVLAQRNPGLVLRANRRTRDTRIARLGSLLFNLECRLLLQIPAWDVNGTPKIFPRDFAALLDLREDGDLLDAEFALVCERESYPVVECPINAELLSGEAKHLDYRAALRMYGGLPRLRSRHQS